MAIEPIENGEQKLSIRNKLNQLIAVVQDGVQEVLTRAERLALTQEEVTVGATWVVQTQEAPNVVWRLVDADPSLDTSWQGMVYTTDPDGDIIVSMELADVTGTVPDLNVMGISGGTPSVGDSITSGGRKVAMNNKPQGMARMVSIKESGVQSSIQSTSGHTGVRWWDGSVQIAPSTLNKSTGAWPADWSGMAPKEVYYWPATGAADPTQSGDITSINVSDENLTELDIHDLTQLTYLNAQQNHLKNLDLSRLSLLEFISVLNNNLSTIDISGKVFLTELYVSDNNLVYLDASGCTSLERVGANKNSFLHMNISNCGSSITQFFFIDHQGATGIGAQPGFPIDATGTSFAAGGEYGVFMQYGNFTNAHLLGFFNSMANGAATIHVYNTPALTDPDWPATKAIAEGKGYTVSESEYVSV